MNEIPKSNIRSYILGLKPLAFILKYRFSIVISIVIISLLYIGIMDKIAFYKSDGGGKPIIKKNGNDIPKTDFSNIDKYLQCLEEKIPQEYLKRCD